MKTKTLTFALLAGLAAFAGTTARADSNDNRFNNNNEPNRAEHRGDYRDDHRHDAPPRTVVVPGPRYVSPSTGYWRETIVKTWVPAHWVMGRDYRGRPTREYVPGHYDNRVERTWVPTSYRR